MSEVKQKIGDLAINGSGIRDTARVLKISPTTVIEELKKTKLARDRLTPDGVTTSSKTMADGG